jgi:uncharacterized protein YkwD
LEVHSLRESAVKITCMRTRLLNICLLVCLTATLTAQVGLSADELKLFNFLNQERKIAGLPQFQWNYRLAEAARAHSELLAQHKELSHQFAGEAALGDRIGVTGARFNSAAENVAEGETGSDAVLNIHTSLMFSPGHRANILSPQYNVVGLAIVSRDGQMYVTEDFAHTLSVYSEAQFRNAVIAAFNKARQARKLPRVTLIDDPRIHDLACSETEKPQIPRVIAPALDEVVFTSSDPDQLPEDMQKAVRDPSLHKMSLGACFHPDKEHGNANFWVVAAFY